jgi:asparagine synthase (glutamine-hydrolysing)
MPGLTGIIFFRYRDESSNASFEGLIKSLMHHYWYRAENLHLRNLSIGCVHTGNLNEQILFSQKGVHVMIHGEIYNDDIMGRDQAAYIARCYEEQGSLFAHTLNGSFAVAIIDEHKKTVFLATDRVGSKPILFYYNCDRFIFAPELKPFMSLTGLSLKADTGAIADVLSNGFMTGRKSLVQNIRYLPGASVCKISDSGVHIKQYWTYTFNENNQDFSLNEGKEELSRLLEQAVKRRMRTCHNYAISLSGGYDSRALVGCCLQAGSPVKTFSYSASEKKFGDSVIAARVSDIAHFEHIHCSYNSKGYLHSIKRSAFLREGMGNVIEEWPVWETLRSDHNIDIVLTGEECFGWQDIYIDSEEAMLQALGIYRLKQFPHYARILTAEAYNTLCCMSEHNLSHLSALCSLGDFHNRKDFFYLNQRLFTLLMWRYAIATEVEVRNPWLDNDILDFMMNVPVRYRRGKKLFKETVESMFPELCAGDFARTSDALNQQDFDSWKDEFKEEINNEFI